MQRLILTLGLALLVPLFATAKDRDSHAKDRQAIEDSIGSYVRAFNARNAKAVADHWSENAEYISRITGDRVTGRAAIQQEIEKQFARDDKLRISVTVDSIRFVSSTVAIEDGTARVSSSEGPSDTSYTAVHVKEKAGWKIDSLRETILPEPPTAQEQLAQLEWLVGEWVDDAGGTSIRTVCRWTANRAFLTRSFTVAIEDRIEMEGTQVIGWNPATKKIQSWIFDTDGGFGTGTWERDGDQWEITTSSVLPDGKKGTRIIVMRRINDNAFTLKSIAREVAGEILPNVEEIVVVRVAENE
ncbi:MAG: SgcJ/EcaC family oxidoreductase [Planctomycetes bacterium]|nr:SgcJ/EcaC family oxidoreductase [Planctomycetota bacterium]